MVLSESKRMMEAIISALPNRVAVLDQNGAMVMVNDAWKDFDWKSRNISEKFDWIGYNYLESYTEASAKNNVFVKKIKNGINAVISGRQASFELEYPYRNGNNTGWHSIHIAAAGNKENLSVLTHSDITKNKIIESAVDGFSIHSADFKGDDTSVATLWADQLNQDLNKIVEDSLNEIFIFDAVSFRFLQVNRGGRNNLGYTLEELLRMTPMDIKPEFTEAMFRALVEPLVSGEQEKIVFNTIHQRKDGSHYHTEIHLQISSLLGEPVFVAIILDITEANRVKQEVLDINNNLEKTIQARTSRLNLNQSKLHMANQMAKIGYWEIDLSNRQKINWSEGFFNLYDFDEAIPVNDSRYFIQFIHDDDKKRVLELSRSAITNKENIQLEYRIITPKGNLKHIRARIHFVKDKPDSSSKLFSIVQDITEQKNINIEREQILLREKEMGQMKSRFVAMASHEFRTPLSTILSSVSLIGRYQKTEEQNKRDKHIDRIKSSVNNLTSILNDFLSLEKLESNKIEKIEKVLDFPFFIQEIHEDAMLLMKGDQKLNINLNRIEEIQIDPHLIRNVLFNLLSNAIKYSPEGTDVDLTCNMADGNLNIMVRDYGIGIPESEHEKMFSRFFRASNVETIKGTGLGLTIVKRYLDILGGKISFDSASGVGTTFIVDIPVS